jgi:hypothetical protein
MGMCFQVARLEAYRLSHINHTQSKGWCPAHMGQGMSGRGTNYPHYVALMKSMPEYLAGESFDVHRAAEAFDIQRETASKVIRWMVENGQLTRHRGKGNEAFSYRKAATNQLSRCWGVKNDIPLGRYYGYAPVTLEALVERHAG